MTSIKTIRHSFRRIIFAAGIVCLFNLRVVPNVQAAFVIDSLDGDITANELKQFTNTINTMTSPTNNWGDAMSTHGTEVEGMRRMYEATGNINILNRLIVFCDVELSHRNDQPLGEHRVMWTGNVEPGWPEGSTNTTPACTTGMIQGNIAYCAMLILQTPAIWTNTIPDGNPNGYGVTYFQRATNYLAKVDSGLSQYLTVWFVNTNTFRIRTPSDSRWLPASSGDTAETAWNRQALFVMAYQYAAKCHDLLGDNPSFLPLYKGVVNAFATWFVAAYPSGGGVYYTTNGHTVAKWYYQVPTDQHIENIGHAQHDMEGLFQAWESGYTGLTDTQMKVYGDTAQFVINLGATNSWSMNVDGTGTPTTSLKTDFIPLARWNPALYKMIAKANIDATQLNVDEGCKNTGYILWMKHWMYLNPPAGSVVPNQPTALIANPGDAKAFLSWSTVDGATNYIVKRATSPGGAYIQVGASNIGGFIDSGLVNGQIYYYLVSGANGVGEGPDSEPVSVVPSASVGAILNTNLVAWIAFDNNTANDWSGHGNNGVVQGTAAIVTDAQRGIAISLDGVGGKVDLGNPSSLDITGRVTVAAWVKGNTAGGGFIRNIVNRGYGGSPTRELTLRYSSSAIYNAGSYDGANHQAAYAIPGGDVNSNTWVHLAGTYDGTNWNLYRNGILVNSLADTNGALPMTVGWAIGARGGSATFERVFDGVIDDVRIYNKSLTQTEIQQVMTNVVNHAPVFTIHPVAVADGHPGKPYIETLAGSADDPDATDTLTFSKISGPSWLTVATNGDLSGTPLQGNLGTNNFVVRVTDAGGLYDEAMMSVFVFVESPVPVIAHWSFDSGSLSISGGNITNVLDETKSHNMSIGTNIGGANGISGTRNSTSIPSSQSIAGTFGQGLTLTGNGSGGNFLMFPNLTELMASSSPTGYSVSMWVKTTSSTFQPYASGLADWGSASGQFAYAFGVNSGTQLRAQTRWGTSGGNDIYARTPATTVNDGNWRMFTWTFDTGTGILKTYTNGTLLETFTSTATNWQTLDSASLVGTLGLKNDTGAFINGTITFDEIWVFDGVLDTNQIANLRNYNSLNTPPAPPQFTKLSVSGGVLSINATNGSGSWTLLQSTNLSLPLNLWQTGCVVTFDGSGNLSTNLINAATNAQTFYILKQ